MTRGNCNAKNSINNNENITKLKMILNNVVIYSEYYYIHNISNLIGSIHIIYNVYKHRINYIADFKIISYILYL